MHNQVIFAICFATVLILLLTGFLFFMLFWQRRKSNRFIRERETMKTLFNEQLLKSQLEIQEQSFNSISMEIHDNVGQTLSLLKVQLNIIDQTEKFDRNLLGEAKSNVGKALVDLRDIAKSLNTDRLQQASLIDITSHELQRVSNLGIAGTVLNCEGEEREVNAGKKLILLRMMQECLQNSIKHAQASLISINFNYNNEKLEVKIKDNGKGFNKDILEITNPGIGLQNIITRARIIGGTAAIESVIDTGTTITITIPYE